MGHGKYGVVTAVAGSRRWCHRRILPQLRMFRDLYLVLSNPALLYLEAAIESEAGWEAEKVNFEGLRVSVEEGDGRAGWLMNRLSLHEPIVIFNVESVSDPRVGCSS